MLHKYRALFRHSEQRLLAGQGRLAQGRDALAREQAVSQRLKSELEFQYQLAQANQLSGASVSRQQLFSWLRKDAADKRHSQALRLDLVRQEQVVDERNQQIVDQHTVCRQLEDKRDRYHALLKQERKRVHVRQENIDEIEIEERFSWFK